MKEIRVFEDVRKQEQQGHGAETPTKMNWQVGRAYFVTKERNNELLDFSDCVFENDVADIVATLREYGVDKFTVSSGFSGLLCLLDEFVRCGCTLGEMVKVNGGYGGITDKQVLVPAIRV